MKEENDMIVGLVECGAEMFGPIKHHCCCESLVRFYVVAWLIYLPLDQHACAVKALVICQVRECHNVVIMSIVLNHAYIISDV